jgi:hypothetical protein
MQGGWLRVACFQTWTANQHLNLCIAIVPAGIDLTAFHRRMEAPLLAALVSLLGAAPADAFVLSVGHGQPALGGATTLKALTPLGSSLAAGAAGGAQRLQAYIIVGGPEPLRMYYTLQTALR